VVNLSAKHQKETLVVDDQEKRGDDKDEHNLLFLLHACALAQAFGWQISEPTAVNGDSCHRKGLQDCLVLMQEGTKIW